jgi:hypothetical protein
VPARARLARPSGPQSDRLNRFTVRRSCVPRGAPDRRVPGPRITPGWADALLFDGDVSLTEHERSAPAAGYSLIGGPEPAGRRSIPRGPLSVGHDASTTASSGLAATCLPAERRDGPPQFAR